MTLLETQRDKTPAATKRIIPITPINGEESALYAKRQQVYPRQVHGGFARWRVIMVFVTLGIYYGLPWINWGEGRQAFLIDLPGRKFNLFLWTFWPQDLFYLTAVLVISALSLFLFTAVAGRLWCGYTCPQTVWTEVFLWIEHRIEGDRPRQMRLASQPWNAEKVLKKGSKHLAWIVFALWTGFTFVGYFTPIRELGLELTGFNLGPWETFWVFFYAFATYGNAGFLREQLCIYMCPYARFQSVMFDRQTLVISYDEARGEPRGSRRRGADYHAQGLGSCIDCTLCVQVCPTGIDIRNGLQIACISCAACVDVCDDVMVKMNYPKGLIRYTTQAEMEEGAPRRFLRPRILIYAGLLAAVGVSLVIAVLLRVPLSMDVLRDRNTLYRETPEGAIENVYTLKVLNMDIQPHRYQLGAEGIEGLRLVTDHEVIAASAGEVIEVPVRLQVDPENLNIRSTPVRFILRSDDGSDLGVIEPARFLGPE